MKTINVADATGPALNWLVAKCEGYVAKGACKADRMRVLVPHPDGGGQLFRPSTDWAQGGPIVERKWAAISRGRIAFAIIHREEGISWDDDGVLVGLMRCYVISETGGTAEVPEELL